MDKFDLKKFITKGKLLKENQSEFESNTPGRIDQFIKDLDNLIEEYHAELYLKDGVFTGIDAVKAAALGEDDAVDDFVATDEDDNDSIFEDREMNSKTQVNELDSLSNVFDTITGEYEDDEGEVVYEPYAYNDLKDLLNSTFKSSHSVDDFIEKITYSMTNTTSVLSLEDQDKLHDWYDVRSEYGSQNVG